MVLQLTVLVSCGNGHLLLFGLIVLIIYSSIVKLLVVACRARMHYLTDCGSGWWLVSIAHTTLAR